MIIAAIVLPMIPAYILVAADMRSDLSDLKPARALADKATALIGWPDLETGREQLVSVEQTRRHSPWAARMLGYMMDGYEPSRDGAQVEMFILMPEAGQFLHPAHRIPGEMVEIWLSSPSPFQYRRMVWVSGVLARTPGRRDPDKASYVMKAASVEPAAQSDLTRWFKP
jgi:hypothetical protein